MKKMFIVGLTLVLAGAGCSNPSGPMVPDVDPSTSEYEEGVPRAFLDDEQNVIYVNDVGEEMLVAESLTLEKGNLPEECPGADSSTFCTREFLDAELSPDGEWVAAIYNCWEECHIVFFYNTQTGETHESMALSANEIRWDKDQFIVENVCHLHDESEHAYDVICDWTFQSMRYRNQPWILELHEDHWPRLETPGGEVVGTPVRIGEIEGDLGEIAMTPEFLQLFWEDPSCDTFDEAVGHGSYGWGESPGALYALPWSFGENAECELFEHNGKTYLAVVSFHGAYESLSRISSGLIMFDRNGMYVFENVFPVGDGEEQELFDELIDIYPNFDIGTDDFKNLSKEYSARLKAYFEEDEEIQLTLQKLINTVQQQ